MTSLSCLGQLVLLTTLLLHHTASLPMWESRAQDDLEGIVRSEISNLNTQSLFARNYVDALVEARLRKSGPHTRQLGDIEFSNRYADYLRSKAKHTSVCASLRRMQSVQKSGLGETMNLNQLMKQYMCPSVYPWAADL